MDLPPHHPDPPGSTALRYFGSQESDFISLAVAPVTPAVKFIFQVSFQRVWEFLEAQFFLLCFLHLTRQNSYLELFSS